MKTDRRDGKRVVTLEGKDHAALAKAKDVCEELADLAGDTTAKATAESLDVLIKQYPAPKKKASAGKKDDSTEQSEESQ